MKKVLSFIICLGIMIGMLAAAPLSAGAVEEADISATGLPSEGEFASKIASLQQTYVHGQYWNKASSPDYSRTGTIPCNGTSYSSSHYGMRCSQVGYCSMCDDDCGMFAWASQCMGYAHKMAYLTLGTYPDEDGWTLSYDMDTINAGDVLRIRNGNHSIFVYKVDADGIYFTDCNWSGPCQVRWGARYTYSQLASTFTYKWHLTGNDLTGAYDAKYNIAYNANGGSGSMSGQTVAPEERFTVKKNSFTRSGYTFSGYYIHRKSDDTWFTADGTGWQKLSVIRNCNYSFYRCEGNASYTIDSAWTAGAKDGDTFTFYAQWQSNTPSLEFFRNYSGFNYLLGSDLTGDWNRYIRSRNNDYYTVEVDTYQRLNNQNSLRITGKQPGASGKDLELKTSTNTGLAEGTSADNKNMVLSFWAKASVSGAKMYARWGYSSSFTAPVTLTTEWAQYTVQIPKNRYNSISVHPYFDEAGTFYINSPVITDGTKTSRFEPETQTVSEKRYYSLNGRYSDLPEPEREGYIFTGWYTDAVGGTRITNGSYVYSGDKRVYAHWLKTGSDIPVDSALSADGSRYELYDIALSWEEAEAFCESMGGHLATISSPQENDTVLSLIDGRTSYSWIGAKYDETRRAWSWITGETFDFSNWAKGEPSNKDGASSVSEPYAMIYPLDYGTATNKGRWNDIVGVDNQISFYCRYNSSFVCEFDPKKLLGDADGSGEIEITDVSLIQRAIADMEVFVSQEILMRGDVDRSGELEITDATVIQRRLADIAVPYDVGGSIA